VKRVDRLNEEKTGVILHIERLYQMGVIWGVSCQHVTYLVYLQNKKIERHEMVGCAHV
jgi:hypothetical protein